MTFRLLAAWLTIAATAPIPDGAAHAQGYLDMMQIEVCNQDGDSRISVAVVDERPEAVGAEGWTRVEANSCQTLYRHTSERTYHHVYFAAPDLGLMKFDFGAGYRGGSFCVSYPDAFEYDDTILSWGRSKECQGSEKLEQSTYRVPGQKGSQRRIFIQPFSGQQSRSDGKICILGFCM